MNDFKDCSWLSFDWPEWPSHQWNGWMLHSSICRGTRLGRIQMYFWSGTLLYNTNFTRVFQDEKLEMICEWWILTEHQQIGHRTELEFGGAWDKKVQNKESLQCCACQTVDGSSSFYLITYYTWSDYQELFISVTGSPKPWNFSAFDEPRERGYPVPFCSMPRLNYSWPKKIGICIISS